MDCIFCKIVNKEIPSDIIYEDDKIMAFKDLNPTAPVHILIIPKYHITSLDDTEDKDGEILKYIMLKIKDIAKTASLDRGYRIVINNGEDGLQTVKHLHIHLLGGKKLSWPAS